MGRCARRGGGLDSCSAFRIIELGSRRGCGVSERIRTILNSRSCGVIFCFLRTVAKASDFAFIKKKKSVYSVRKIGLYNFGYPVRHSDSATVFK